MSDSKLGLNTKGNADETNRVPTPEQHGTRETCVKWEDHDFKEEYYGYECSKCHVFWAYGMAPWETPQSEWEASGMSVYDFL